MNILNMSFEYLVKNNKNRKKFPNSHLINVLFAIIRIRFNFLLPRLTSNDLEESFNIEKFLFCGYFFNVIIRLFMLKCAVLNLNVGIAI